MNDRSLSRPTRERLTRLWDLLQSEGWAEGKNFSSHSLARWLNVTPETLRRDLSFLNGGRPGAVWEPERLRERLRETLGLDEEGRAVLVGLEDWAVDLLIRKGSGIPGLRIVAGFDSRQNRLETLELNLPLYPSVEIPQRVRELRVRTAVLTASVKQAAVLAERLVQGGVQGILNLSGYPLKESRHLRVVDGSIQHLWSRLLTSLASTKEPNHGQGL